MRRRVVITGMGLNSGLGQNLTEAWGRIRSGITALRDHQVSVPSADELQTRVLAAPAMDEGFEELLESFDRKLVGRVDRSSNLAALAALQAVNDAGLVPEAFSEEDCAVVIGAASGGNNSVQAAYERMFLKKSPAVHPLTLPGAMPSGPASHVSVLFKTRGICFCTASACAGSAHAIGEAMHLISSGRAEVAIAGGGDASLNFGSVMSWKALRAVSDSACRPFSLDRDGTGLGEGGAIVILESLTHARKRGANIVAEVVGYGASSDAGHLTQPDHKGAILAIERAYSDLEIKPALISAHGTGTVLNDKSEARALRHVFGDVLKDCLVTATKSLHGHMLGASGAAELVIAIKAMNSRQMPPIAGFMQEDPDCDLPLILKPEEADFDYVLSTAFGFGGANCALVVKKFDE